MQPTTREGFDGGLSAALFPVLLHKLANATQLLTSLNSLLALDGGAELALSRTEDLARTSSQVEDLGWMLAALASAAGADLVMERREPEALSIFARALREALRRRGRELAVEPDPLPRLAPRAAHGWELPWALGALLYSAGESLPAGAPLRLQWERDPSSERARFRASGGEAVRALAPEILSRVPGAEFRSESDSWELTVPLSWLEPERPPPPSAASARSGLS